MINKSCIFVDKVKVDISIHQDPRFNSAIDMRTGYKTTLILSMPICNYEGDVIGVAQIINKTNGSNEFTDRDVEVFQRWAETIRFENLLTWHNCV